MLCERLEEARKALYDAGEVPTVVAALSHKATAVQAAAASLLRSLSRSERLLRTALVEANAAVPLLQLLKTAEPAIKATAAAALCNIVLVFTPMREHLIRGGAVKEFISLTDSRCPPELRLNAVWALKNLCFQANPEVKAIMFRELRAADLLALAEDADQALSEQAVALLRNLVYGSAAETAQALEYLGAAVRRVPHRSKRISLALDCNRFELLRVTGEHGFVVSA